MTVSSEVRQFVWSRAENSCEYCRLPSYASVLPHQVDHIIGRQAIYIVHSDGRLETVFVEEVNKHDY